MGYWVEDTPPAKQSELFRADMKELHEKWKIKNQILYT